MTSAVDNARSSIIVSTAEANYLSIVGNNYGVPRPPGLPGSDDVYKCVIQVLAWLPKTILHTMYKLAECIFGTQADITTGGNRAWAIFEVVPNEIIFEVPSHLIEGILETASYLHGFPSEATTPAGPNVDTFTCPGDITESAVSLTGLTVYLFYSSTWNAHTVNSATYSSGTGLSTVVTSATDIPGGLTGVGMFLDVPGDGINSYEGDFMAPDASEAADGTSPVTLEHDRRVYLYGKGLLDIFEFYMNTFVRAAGVTLRIEEI